ncbi:hypothetical protein NL676_000825 [Syzygium grande]|nr:hypothetical protein NL676_000825 [Syzygium grande]
MLGHPAHRYRDLTIRLPQQPKKPIRSRTRLDLCILQKKHHRLFRSASPNGDARGPRRAAEGGGEEEAAPEEEEPRQHPLLRPRRLPLPLHLLLLPLLHPLQDDGPSLTWPPLPPSPHAPARAPPRSFPAAAAKEV